MAGEPISVQLELTEALFLLLSAKLNHEFLDSIQIEDHRFGGSQMQSLIQKLEGLVGSSYSALTDDVLEELINSFLPELPIRTAASADYSFPMYSIEDTLPQVQEALKAKQVLRIEYYSMDREEVNSRDIEPMFLEKRYNHYLLVAYCRWREDIRLFRVDRMKSVEILSETFELPDDFVAETYLGDEHI